MAMIFRNDNGSNKVVVASYNTICKLCLDKAIKEARGSKSIHEIKQGLMNKLVGKKAYKLRVTGIDHYFCNECIKKINEEVNGGNE